MTTWNNVPVASVKTAGLSFAQIESTLVQPSVQNSGMNLAAFNGMNVNDITGKPYNIYVPLSWLNADFTGMDPIDMSQVGVSQAAANLPVATSTNPNYSPTYSSGASSGQIIPGLSNMVLFGSIGVLALILMMGGKK